MKLARCATKQASRGCWAVRHALRFFDALHHAVDSLVLTALRSRIEMVVLVGKAMQYQARSAGASIYCAEV